MNENNDEVPDGFNEDYIERQSEIEHPFTNEVRRELNIRQYRESYEDCAEESEQPSTIAGRIIRYNDVGPLVFIDVRDETGVVQVVIREGSERFEERDVLQVGDHIEVSGTPTRTDTGEFSMESTDWRVLTPASRDIPFRTGLSEQQQAHDRVGALLVDDELRGAVETRFEVQRLVRDILSNNGFREVQTPVLHQNASGAAAEPFETHANATDSDMALRVAPELYLKRLVMSGFEHIFEVGPNFRNESADSSHNPEFTMLELYSSHTDYVDMMHLTERIVDYVLSETHGSTELEYCGDTIDFSLPWDRVDYVEAIEDGVGHPVSEWDEERVFGLVEARFDANPETRADAYETLYDEYVEPEITDPTFIVDHPRDSTPLCSTHRSQSDRVERFEVVVAGMEIANAYTELTDPFRQQEAFNQQSTGESESYESDNQYVEDLGYGLPPTGGLGIGLDRLAMLIAGEESIRRVLPFPLTAEEE
jgi:lysyl-tRNA synthetase class 2